MNRKFLIIVSMLVLFSVSAVSAAEGFSIMQDKEIGHTTVDVFNITDVESFKNNATELINGDSVICLSEFRQNVQYSRGVHIDHWYVGNGTEDIYPHHTKLVKTELFYKNAKGEIISIEKTNNTYSFPFVEGYSPFKAEIWYTID